MFKIGDVNGDGVLSAEEFADVLSTSGFRFEQSVIDKMVAAADVNGDGVIDFEEFVPAMMKLGETMQEELFGKKSNQGASGMPDLSESTPEKMAAKLTAAEASAEVVT